MRTVDDRLAHADLARRVRCFQAVAGWIRSLELCLQAGGSVALMRTADPQTTVFAT
jgi:hypothetical protein